MYYNKQQKEKSFESIHYVQVKRMTTKSQECSTRVMIVGVNQFEEMEEDVLSHSVLYSYFSTTL